MRLQTCNNFTTGSAILETGELKEGKKLPLFRKMAFDTMMRISHHGIEIGRCNLSGHFGGCLCHCGL